MRNSIRLLFAGIAVFLCLVVLFMWAGRRSPSADEDKTKGDARQQHPTAAEAESSSVAATPAKEPGLAPAASDNLRQAQIAERTALFENLTRMPPERLWQDWLATKGQRGWQRRILEQALSNALAVRPQIGAAYDQMLDFLLSETESPDDQQRLAKVVSDGGTPECLGILLEALIARPDATITRDLVGWVSNMSLRSDGDAPAGEYLATAKAAWAHWMQDGSTPPRGAFDALAAATARIGTQDAVRFLMETATAGGMRIEDLEAAGSAASISAINVAGKVFSPESAPLLGEYLVSGRPGDTAFHWAGEALANMGSPLAVEQLVDWAKAAPSGCAEIAGLWLRLARDTDSRQKLLDFRRSGGLNTIVDTDVRQAVASAIATFEQR